MKVLLLSHIYVVGVNQAKVEALAQGDGIELTLVAPKLWSEPTHKIALEKGFSPHYRIVPMRIFWDGRLFEYFYDPWALFRLGWQYRPDIVHIEEEPHSAAGFQAAWLAKRLGCKFILFTFENIDRPLLPHRWLFEKYILRRADGIIAGNQEAAALMVQKGFRGPIEVLSHLGVDHNLFRKMAAEGLKARLGLRGFVIGFVGRLVEEKGILTLLEAVARLGGDYTLLLVGRGPLKDRVLTRGRELGLEGRVILMDLVPHSEVPRFMSCMDVAVLPSLTTAKWKEQFGHVLIEAMACQVPVVGSSSGAIPEVLGEAGLVFREGDAGQLAEKLAFLEAHPELREELGRKGRERVLQEYTVERIAERTTEMYRRICYAPPNGALVAH